MKGIIFLLLFIFLNNFCDAAVSVVGELSHEKIVKLGERVEGIIFLKNNGEIPAEVRIYQTDYLFFADGRNIYSEPGSVSRSNAKWISLGPTRLTILPNQTNPVHYILQVPDDSSLKGSYWSMIMVEPIALAPLESITKEKGKIKLGVQTIVRYGIQIVTDIGDTGVRKIRFANKKIINEEGKKLLQIDIENIGERWLSPLVWTEIYNEKGQSMGRLQGDKFRIYPGCSVRQKFDLTRLMKGKYKALIVCDNGDEHIFGGRFELRVE